MKAEDYKNYATRDYDATTEKESKAVLKEGKFLSKLGTLSYPGLRTNAELTGVCQTLARLSGNPGLKHLELMNNLIGYVKYQMKE